MRLLRLALTVVTTTNALSLGAQAPVTPARDATGASAPVRVARAVRRTAPVRIDGQLDDASWREAEPSGDFLQSWPAPGKAATERSEVRVLYDDQALYVGVRMFDASPDSIASGLGRRDATGATGIYSDWVHLVVDSYHDRRTAFRFSATPRGVQKDVYHYNDGQEDLNWDAVWEVGTQVDSLGWVAEYRIPLSQLRYGASGQDGARTWGFQVQREIARRSERDTWAPWTPQDGGFVSRFGDLAGLVGVPQPERLEVMPYLSTRVTRAPGDAANPFYRRTSSKPSVGGDIKYGLPSGLTLSATVNPDFGQVEVDPAVVNLSAFETFFPEKRPFFLEGSDVFGFGQVVRQNDYGGQFFLYSRRIGRQPQRAVRDARFVDAPEQASIAGAAKVTGKVGAWTVGLLDAVTLEQRARVLSPGGARYDAAVEPRTNYFAGRLKRDFRRGASTVGAMLQHTSRAVDDTAFVSLLRSDASFGGIDFEHNMRNRSVVASGYVAGSRVRGSPRAIASTQENSTHYFQRPDAAHLSYDSTRTALAGYIGQIALARRGANFGSITYKETSPGLELNDLGFQSRTDYRALSTVAGHSNNTAGKRFRQYSAVAFSNDTWNFDGTAILHAYGSSANFSLLNLWGGGGSIAYQPGNIYSDRLLRGGPQARLPATYQANAYAYSDSRRPVSGNLSGGFTDDASGGGSQFVSVSADLRPASTLRVSVGPNLSRQHNTAQFVRSVREPMATATFGRRYLFADLHQTTLSIDTRVDFTLSPTLSFVMYAQPFVSAGRYEDLKEFLRPDGYDFAVYGRDRGTSRYDAATRSFTVDPDGEGPAAAFVVGDPSFNIRSLRGNAVMRWDYRPGSALYFVWQQQRSDYEPIGDFAAGRDVGAIFRGRPTNVFLLKATYWLGR